MRIGNKSSIIFISALFYFQVGYTHENVCLETSKANPVIEKFNWWDTKNTPISDFSADLCNPKSAIYKVINALIALNELPPLDDRKDELNANIIDMPPFDFFSQRVNNIFFDDQKTRHCVGGTTLAYVLIKTSVVHICPSIAASTTTEVMKVLIHESRHTEGYGHVLCDHGDQSNSNIYACDQSYESHGSYGIDTEFQIRLARTPEISPEIRAEARAGAINRLLNRFNKYPAGVTEGIMGQTEDGRLLFLNKDLRSIVSQKVKNNILINFNGFPAWYDKTSSQIFMPNYSGGFVSTKGTIPDQITEILRERGSDLSDYYFNAHHRYVCFLSGNNLDCSIFLNGEVRKKSLTLPSPGLSFIYLKDFVGVRLQDGRTVSMPQYVDLLNSEGQEISPSDNVKSTSVNTVVSENGNLTYSLDDKGLLYLKNDSVSEPLQLAKDLRFKKIIGPFMWSDKFTF